MLKTLVTFVLAAIVLAGNAQLNLYIKGGINSTNTIPVKTKYGDIYNHRARTGVQAGLQAEYTMENWLLYAGLSLDNKPAYFENKGNNSGSYGYNITYKPIFITLPAGLARSYALTKSMALRVYGGLYVSAGLGGKYRIYDGLCDVGCPEKGYTDSHIQYGPDGDLARVNWGIQVGLGLLASQKFELVSLYSAGLSGIWPGDSGVYNSHLSTISLDFKVHLKTLAAGKK